MLRNIVEEFRFNGPAEEVQFPNGGQERLLARNLEENPLAAAVRVEVLFRISLQLGLIRYIDKELVAVQIISDEVLAAVVSHKPVNKTEG